jgi:hypothetical protein
LIPLLLFEMQKYIFLASTAKSIISIYSKDNLSFRPVVGINVYPNGRRKRDHDVIIDHKGRC